jgi:glycosyltransferase involved in cell wall biosynthesis
LSDHIVFLGHKPPDMVRKYLQNIEVLILPEQYENMSPLIMVEAMMLAKPVVASRLGGIPEYLRERQNGYLANPYDPADFAQKAVLLLKDADLRRSIGAAALKSITERNNNDAIWELTQNVYLELAGKKSSHHGQTKTRAAAHSCLQA